VTLTVQCPQGALLRQDEALAFWKWRLPHAQVGGLRDVLSAASGGRLQTLSLLCAKAAAPALPVGVTAPRSVKGPQQEPCLAVIFGAPDATITDLAKEALFLVCASMGSDLQNGLALALMLHNEALLFPAMEAFKAVGVGVAPKHQLPTLLQGACQQGHSKELHADGGAKCLQLRGGTDQNPTSWKALQHGSQASNNAAYLHVMNDELSYSKRCRVLEFGTAAEAAWLFGQLQNAERNGRKIFVHHKDGRGALAEFETSEEAARAFAILCSSKLNGRQIVVQGWPSAPG